jgi:hypothetical protein
MMSRTPTGMLLSIMALGLVGCGDAPSPSAPSAPPSVPQPGPRAGGLQPTVAAMTPRIGSTRGGAWARITGADFQSAATVRLGGAPITATVLDSATIAVLTPAHETGTVDVVVTNPGGLSNTLAGGYAYQPPETFDFNGDWVAHVGPDFALDMRFTIRNNALVSLSCNMSPSLTPAAPLSVNNGEFAFQNDDGLTMSGRLVSPVGAAGTIDMPNVPECRAARWWADKQ